MKKIKIISLLMVVLLLTGCSVFGYDLNFNKNKNTIEPSPQKDHEPEPTLIDPKKNSEPTPTNPEPTRPAPKKDPEPTPTPEPIKYNKYEIGDEVTVKGEAFYVFQKSSETSSTVTLFAKYNLTKDGKKQAPNANHNDTKVEFSSEVYWEEAAKAYTKWDDKKFDLNTINGNKTGDAITKARNYAKSLGASNGRLITYEEVDKMKDNYKVMIGGQDNSGSVDKNQLYYYTSSVRPFNIYKVYAVRGHSTPTLEVDSALYGVRPIITVSKSLIDK